MEEICEDKVFGKMAYKHRWYKKQKIVMFGKEWEITIAAKAYSGKAITEEQRKSYSCYCEKENEWLMEAGEKLKSYVNANIEKMASYWKDAKRINNVNELAREVTPKTLLFKQDGSTVLLFDCAWDMEHGVAVKLIPEFVAGPQDLFL